MFQVKLKWLLGLVIPNQYCQGVMKVLWGWFGVTQNQLHNISESMAPWQYWLGITKPKSVSLLARKSQTLIYSTIWYSAVVLYIRDHGGLGFLAKISPKNQLHSIILSSWQYWLGINKPKRKTKQTICKVQQLIKLSIYLLYILQLQAGKGKGDFHQ